MLLLLLLANGEAVAGLAAALGADHPDTRYAREVLDYWEKRKDNSEESQEPDGEEEEEETIADRIRKRRRRA